MRLRILKFLLMLVAVLLGSSGCDPAPGPIVEFFNSTGVVVSVYNDPLFVTVDNEIVAVEPDSTQPNYLLTKLKPGEKRRISVSNVAWVSEELRFIVRALTEEGAVIFQRVMTVEEMLVPDLVIEITDEWG